MHAIGFWYVAAGLILVGGWIALVLVTGGSLSDGRVWRVVLWPLGPVALVFAVIGVGLRSLLPIARYAVFAHLGLATLFAVLRGFSTAGEVIGSVVFFFGAIFVVCVLVWERCAALFSPSYRALVRAQPGQKPWTHSSPLFYVPAGLFLISIVLLIVSLDF